MLLWLSQSFIQPVDKNSKIQWQTKSQDNWMKRNEKIKYQNNQPNPRSQRGTSLFISQRNCKGSLTLEAALVLPIVFIIFFIIYNFFAVMNVQQSVQKVLEDTADEFARSYYAVENLNGKMPEDQRISSVFYSTFTVAAADVKVKKKLNKMNGLFLNIPGGAAAVSLTGSYYDDATHRIVLQAKYPMRALLFNLFGIEYQVSQKAYRHVWVGRSDPIDRDTIYVYITKTGTVYHTSLTCSHLNIQIRQVSKADISLERNESGSRYQPCEFCGKKAGDVLYITAAGTKYHHDLNCSGLRRNIFSIPITDVGTRRLCQRCGGQ